MLNGNWKDVVGASLYMVNDIGDVFSKKSNRKLKTHKSIFGYINVTIKYDDGIYRCRKVHKLMAESFIENIGNMPIVNHINGKRSDNRIENLEWCTHSYNVKDGVDRRIKNIEKYNTSKLSPEAVLSVITFLNCGFNCKQISESLGVHSTTVQLIKRKKTWAHIGNELLIDNIKPKRRPNNHHMKG